MKVSIGKHEIEIDEKDTHFISCRKWGVVERHGKFVVKRWYRKDDGKLTSESLHHVLFGLAGRYQRVRFLDGNTLNLTRANMVVENSVDAAFRKTGAQYRECPFSEGRLRELLWMEMKTIDEIRTIAQELAGWDKLPSSNTVMRWLRQHNIPSNTDEKRRAAQAKVKTAGKGFFSDTAKKKSQETNRLRRRPVLIEGKVHRPPVPPQFAQANKRRYKGHSRTGVCITCGATIKRELSRAPKGDIWTCNNDCYQAYLNRRANLKAEIQAGIANLKKLQEELEGCLSLAHAKDVRPAAKMWQELAEKYPLLKGNL